MSQLQEFIIKNVRCFENERANIRPITLLIGENSTGKTSFLASYRILHRAVELINNFEELQLPLEELNFNAEPFQMGAFRDIVRSNRGKSNDTDKFLLGCSVYIEEGNKKYDLLFSFSEKGSEPKISSIRLNFSTKSYFEMRVTADGEIIVEIPNRTIKSVCFFGDMDTFIFLGFFNYFFRNCIENVFPEILTIKESDFKTIRAVFQESGIMEVCSDSIYPKLNQERSVAPVRSKPRRTYDPLTESPTPEGDYIPMLMMRLLHTKDKRWNMLHDNLVKFGQDSGLFSEIKMKSHGQQTNDPFKLQVKIRKGGPEVSIIDVGYGVSQILPILVEIAASEATTFLLQQPEVHLHPRAQAEFSSFLAKSVCNKKHTFLIETHSDHIIDRVRISVQKDIIKPEDVSILYFEPQKTGGAVKIHNLSLDKQGNLIDVPKGYRDFFMEESNSLLGFK